MNVTTLEKLLATQRQAARSYLAEATELVWKMQRALGVISAGVEPQEPGSVAAIAEMAARLSVLGRLLEGVAATETLFRDMYRFHDETGHS